MVTLLRPPPQRRNREHGCVADDGDPGATAQLTDGDIDPLGDDQLAAAIVLRSVRRLIRLSTPGPG
ncbi:MAG TPA: hypothetical protein VF391_06245 [Dermatophilaceae bacterium]